MQPDCDNHVQVDTVSCELQLELQKGISQAGRERGRKNKIKVNSGQLAPGQTCLRVLEGTGDKRCAIILQLERL